MSFSSAPIAASVSQIDIAQALQLQLGLEEPADQLFPSASAIPIFSAKNLMRPIALFAFVSDLKSIFFQKNLVLSVELTLFSSILVIIISLN